MKSPEPKSNFMFDAIADIYALFFASQKKKFESAVQSAKSAIDISSYKNALDVGCGTGAMCAALTEWGIKMTGIDSSKRMLSYARRKNSESVIDFIFHDASAALPFGENAFDFSIASYVAHGMTSEMRKTMLLDMKRVSARYVILHDYAQKRKPLTDIIESLEGGNYFEFIKTIRSELDSLFTEVAVVSVGDNANWYICRV